MKKLIFLLLMAVFLTGFVSALDTVQPPGDQFLEAALPGYSADSLAVTPVTVSGAAQNDVVFILPTGFIALSSGNDNLFMIFDNPALGNAYRKKPLDTGKQADYWLLL